MASKEQIMLVFNISDEPNETIMHAIHFDGSSMSIKPFNGFAAMDIYNILTGNDEEGDN